MQYAYKAMTSAGAIEADTIDAGTQSEAAETLRKKGMMVLHLEASPQDRAASHSFSITGRIRTSDLLLFTRQMKMLLEAGAALVPALEAIERQSRGKPFESVARQVRETVENGGSLSEAFQEHPSIFKPIFCTIVAAGEATAALPESFGRLHALAQQQDEVRKAILAAVSYPAFLAVMCAGVVTVLIGFVVPRFKDLFDTLRAPVPFSTQVMFAISDAARTQWPFLLVGLAGLAVGLVLLLRTPVVREKLDALLPDVPLVGRLRARLAIARILRVWAAMLRCHVPLLEAISQSKSAVSNPSFQKLVADVGESVSAGGFVGPVLAESRRLDPVISSAISIGEQNGRLAEAVDFVSTWMDGDNAQLLRTAMRILEPTLLGVMGLVVGAVAMGLFLPLFDVATAAR